MLKSARKQGITPDLVETYPESGRVPAKVLRKQVAVLETQQQPKDMANKSDILDGGGGDARGRSPVLEEQVPIAHWEFKPEVEVDPVIEMMEEGICTANFYPEMQTEELSAVYRRTGESIDNVYFRLKSILNWVWNEVERKQMAEAGIDDRAKSFMEK
ncbi:hypothetical protein ZWY2020_012573 [Hordeum vulgare]|nr:hypothetical protein ZWY2020_005500 [Hordeum vulgare]KAI5010436.1 hypothetical protein ZWY2020_012573 [Hordeum vulgare]